MTGLPTACSINLGNGANSLGASTYVKARCANEFGSTYTISGIKCRTDNPGATTLRATNGAGAALLTGAIRCGNTGDGVAGSLSGTVTIAAGDFIKFTIVADGVSKDVMVTVAGSR